MTDLSTNAPVEHPEPSRSLRRIGVTGIFFVLVVVGLVFLWLRPRTQSSSSTSTPTLLQEQSLVPNEPQPTATPMPFAELTIPYLRARQYESKLGALQPVAETASYTSYLTHYASDGLRVNGLLTQPKGTPPQDGWPAIVFVHGYIPPSQYRTRQNYVSYMNVLASNGFVVFKIDLRGHDISEGEASGAYYSSDYIIDTLSAHAALQTAAFVNPEKIGLWGHSMAGNVLLRSLAAKPDIPAVAIWAGAVYTYSDFREYGIDDGSYRPPASDSPARRKRQELFNTYGEFDPNSPFWKHVPATNYLDGITGEVGLFHAIDDRVVSINYSRNLKRILDKEGIATQFHEYASGGHNLTGATFSRAMQDTLTFFKTYL